MNPNQFIPWVRRELDQQIQAFTNSLTAGSAKDHAEYLRAVGTIEGLNRAKQVIADAVEKLNGNDLQEDEK